MGILSKLKDLILPSSGMVCLRCEKALEGHDEAACERRMSRRYFFQVAAGATAAVVVASAAAPGLLQEFVVTEVVESGNTFLTVEMITTEALKVLRNNMVFSTEINRKYEGGWGGKIGDTLNIRKPATFALGDKFTIHGLYAVNPATRQKL